MPKRSELTPNERKARESKRIAAWQHENPEKVRAYRLRRIRKAALQDVLANSPEFADFCRSEGLCPVWRDNAKAAQNRRRRAE